MSDTNESRFPPTSWTLVRKARNDPNPAEARVAFDRLCRDYRDPLLACALAYKSRYKCPREDADRLVNELFYRMKYELFPSHHPDEEMPDIDTKQRPIGKQGYSSDDTPLLERAENLHAKNSDLCGAKDGRLRVFFMRQLKTIFDTDLRTRDRENQDGRVFSTGDISTVEHKLHDDLKGMQSAGSPDEIFRLRWIHTLLQLARQALKQEMERKGELQSFEVLCRLLDRDKADPLTSEQAADLLGITDGGVRANFKRFREKLKGHIRQQILYTVDSEAMYKEELRYLFPERNDLSLHGT